MKTSNTTINTWKVTSTPLPVFFMFMLMNMLFQNFDFAEALKVNLVPINEQARSHHAKELLGKHYEGSPAQVVEKSNSLGFAIHQEVFNQLPKAYQTQSPQIVSTILKTAEKYEIDPVFVLAVIKTESRFNPLARGRFGEIGLMQVKPTTAEWIAQKYHLSWRGKKTLENPISNIRIGLAYFDYLRTHFAGHAGKYVAAYNMGAKNVRRSYAAAIKPKEYSTRVMDNYTQFYQRLVVATSMNMILARAY